MNGQRLADRYVLIEVLGEGAMGVVWRAWDESGECWCAAKLLHPGLLASELLVERFRREIEALRRLDHPRIVALRDHGVENGLGYLVMDFLDGGSLEGWLHRHGPLAPRAAALVLLDLCEAMTLSHAEGIVHRDIKPANVLIGPDGRVRLADFGLARFADAQVLLTRTGARMGSVGFMAPEQHRNARDVDHRADLFAAGATLYHLLSRKAPFDMDRALAEDYEILSPGLSHVIMRATLPNREHRYASADDMATAIRRILPSLPSLPAGVPPLYERLWDALPAPRSNPTLIL
jgi:serine/threonine-protein kinase